MNNKILTLDNLYEFYSLQNKTCKFSAKKTGYQISVQVPAQFEINKDLEDNSLLFCKVKLMHSGENRNHSSVTDDALIKASKTLAYKPILANFMEYTDEESGEILKDFTSHDIEFNTDGSINYLEKQIGCFTSDEPYFEIEEQTGHNFLYGYCAIPREYTDACSIIERKNGTKVSVELAINELSFNGKTKVLELTDVVIMGATCLGKNQYTLKDVGEGMLNARLDIADFSIQNNSIIQYANKLDSLTSKVDLLLSRFDINNNTREEDEVKVENLENNFDEVTEDEVTETETTEEDVTVTEENSEETVDETPEESESTVVVTESEESDDVEEDVNNDATIETEACGGSDKKKAKKKCSEESLEISFEISHDDVYYALYNLLSQYEEIDNTYYGIRSVYDTYFIFEDWFGGAIYGQKYVKENDNVSFDGERYNLHAEYLTDSEYAELQSMRSNYSALVEYKETIENNELHARREEVLNNEKYSSISETDSFKKLYSEMDNYSVEELEKEVKIIFADNVDIASFSVNTENKNDIKVFANVNKNKKDNRYGNLFSK